MNAEEYRAMSPDELESRGSDLRKSLFNLRTRAATKELDNVARIGQEKKELARILTIIAEKKTS